MLPGAARREPVGFTLLGVFIVSRIW